MPADGYTPTEQDRMLDADTYVPTDDVVRQAATFPRRELGKPRDITPAAFDRWLARVHAEAGAQALRDAVEAIDGAKPRHLGDFGLDPRDYSTGGEYGIDCVAEFLIARADTITQEDTP